MPVPYLAGALKGWTSKISVITIIQTVVDFVTVEIPTTQILDINIQSIPQRQVDRKPEGERSWNWVSVIVKNGPYLKTDDKIVISPFKYRITKGSNWSSSGFTKYEAIQDYEESP